MAVEFAYRREFVDIVRRIRGRQWHPEERRWTVPASRDTVARLLSAFPEAAVRLHPSLYPLAGTEDRRTLGAKSTELVEAAGEELRLRGYARRTRGPTWATCGGFCRIMPVEPTSRSEKAFDGTS